MNIEYYASKQLYFPVNEKGFLTPPIENISNISPINVDVINALRQECENILADDLTHVFFRGSQLFNATPYSDMDIVVIIKDTSLFTNAEVSARINKSLYNKYRHIMFYDVLLLKYSDVLKNRELQFIIKVLAIKIYGDPIEAAIAPFKPDAEIVFTLKNIDRKFEMVQDALSRTGQIDNRIIITNYAIKFLIRSCFELVIPLEKKYTRDLHLCQLSFLKYYPEFKEQTTSLLSKYNKSNFKLDEFLAQCAEVKEMLKMEYKKM